MSDAVVLLTYVGRACLLLRQPAALRDTLLGNEGNNTIRGGLGIDTITGGTSNDLFAYGAAADDGDNANAGGPVEFVTDVNWAEDRFLVFVPIVFVAATGPGAAANLEDAADNALAASLALAGGGAQRVAAPSLSMAAPTCDRPGRRVRCVHRYARSPDRHHRRDRHGRPGEFHDVSPRFVPYARRHHLHHDG